MRLKAFNIRNLPGLSHVQASDLSDVIVFAGPNGVGKTRLLRALIDFFRNPKPRADFELAIEATSEYELKQWGKADLNTAVEQDCQKLRSVLQKTQRRNRYRSTVLNFDSDRAITQIRPFSFSWDIPDPYEEDVEWGLSYSFLRDRYQDVRDSLFKLVEHQRRKIADDALKLKALGSSQMPLDFKDPLGRFKAAFFQLLGPKELTNANVKTQQILYTLDGNSLELDTLSSGEREVINVVFDFILRNPSDCIVLFDEPELHLHPELSYKLLQTLSSSGTNNQFIFSTHSPEIITASIENSVIFLTPKPREGTNHALAVNREDATHHALNLLGQSIGIISLGKKLVLIEGGDSSLDKQTYGAILRNEFPEFVLVPVGGKGTIQSFDEVRQSVLNQTIWGVEFFMLCDRDAELEIGTKSVQAHLSSRLKLLPRYHLENYFLDETILSEIFADMEPAASWLRDPTEIGRRLSDLAAQTVPIAVALRVAAAARESVGNIDIKPKGINSNMSVDDLVGAIDKRVTEESQRIAGSLDRAALDALARAEYAKLMKAANDGTGGWKRDIPGRIIFNRFAGMAQMKPGRLKKLYLQKAQGRSPDPFVEIREIFRSFSAAT
jgi:ABC-type cobalamin/Fe3+-siderophores transport system ATPase subunit